MLILLWIICYFYPRPLRGGRRFFRCAGYFDLRFLSTPSARRATTVFRDSSTITKISIHALCEEGDYKRTAKSAKVRDFYPRPLRGGRPFNEIHKAKLRYISIHALCEEGDQSSSSTSKICSYFYPRPLRGGRPRAAAAVAIFFISIHALCEEGDRKGGTAS